MNALKKRIFPLLAALILLMISTATYGQSTPQQWLVLNNGQTIEGTVTAEQQRYIVATESGSRIVINESNVRFVADSLDEVFWDRWTRTDPQSESQQADLFKWCLRHQMTARAQEIFQHIAMLPEKPDQATRSGILARLSADLETAIAKQLQRENALAQSRASEIQSLPTLSPPPERQTASEIPQIPKLNSTPSPSIEPQPNRTITAEGVQLVNWEQPVEKKQTDFRPAKHLITKAIRKMPRGTARQYKVNIQQKLLSNCASCHDLKSHSMPLATSKFGNSVPQWMTSQNLYSVLQTKSLLQMATTAHGEQKKAAFSPADPFVAKLAMWLTSVTGQVVTIDSAPTTALPTPAIATPTITASPLVTPPQVMPQPEPAAPLPTTAKDAYDPAGFNADRSAERR